MSDTYDLKTLGETIVDKVKAADSAWEAEQIAMPAFKETYPQPEKPQYVSPGDLSPRLIDHSAGYIGVAFRDENIDGPQITLIFSIKNEIHEVYVQRDDLMRFAGDLEGVNTQYLEALKARNHYKALMEKWDAAMSEWRDVVNQAGRVGRALWERLKKQRKLVNNGDNAEKVVDDIPF